ncbi:nuclear transport factor 2 family protein [Actinacidiphila sp. bgisy145]|uniref:nuclear transport factor 2 family protein n=1 Tax=Actinacidiphila sp. bgisy145 TaxID=3413792 RepID=UPI003EBB00F4
MATSAQHRTAFEALLACVDGRAGKDAVASCLAENVVLNSPILDEPVTGRDAVAEVLQAVYALGDLTTEEVLSGEAHQSAFFRLQIEDTVVNGMDYARFDPDGKIIELSVLWRPLPSAVEMQGNIAHLLGMQPWELRTKSE